MNISGFSIYFIILFYFIDMAVDEGIMHAKSNKIVKHIAKKGKQKSWMRYGLLSAIILLVAVAVIHVALYFIFEGIVFKQEGNIWSSDNSLNVKYRGLWGFLSK